MKTVGQKSLDMIVPVRNLLDSVRGTSTSQDTLPKTIISLYLTPTGINRDPQWKVMINQRTPDFQIISNKISYLQNQTSSMFSMRAGLQWDLAKVKGREDYLIRVSK